MARGAPSEGDLTRPSRPVLIVATPGEAEGLAPLGTPVVVSGIGAVNAALAAHEAATRYDADLLVSVGIAGAYPSGGLSPGDVVVASELVYAGLGARDGDDFLDLEQLGFPLLPGTYNRLPAWSGSADVARLVGASFGPVLTLETVTGDNRGALELERRHPGALAEAMEGAGVAHAGLRLGVPTMELRGISNLVGPRDRSAWRLPEAVRAYRAAVERWLSPELEG